MTRFVLASRSPARADLLKAAGVACEIEPADVDEAALKTAELARGSAPATVARALAAAKALDVASRTPGLVLGADQTLDLDGRLIDKPRDVKAARAQLDDLNGRTHRLHSAIALAQDGGVVWSHVETATMTVRPCTDGFFDAYLALEGAALLGCVGAYRYEGLGVQLFDRVEGDQSTIMGLPLLPLLAELRRRGVILT